MIRSDFLTVRRQFRENFDLLKVPVSELKKLFSDTNEYALNLKPIVAVQVSMETWFSFQKKKRIHRTLKKTCGYKNFLKDCLEVFEVEEEAGKAYGDWYQFTQKCF